MTAIRIKIRIILLLLLSSLALFGGCAGNAAPAGDKTGAAAIATETSEASDVGKASDTAGSSAASSDAGGESAVKAWSAAYYDAVRGLIEKYRFYRVSDEVSWSNEMGFVRGDLIDFDGDGVPELVCIYRKEYYHNVCIYQYRDNKAVLLADELAGTPLSEQDWSDIEFSGHDEKPYILIQDTGPNNIENIEILAAAGGTLKKTTLSAEVQENRLVYHYFNCTINGREVTEDEYVAIEDEYFDQQQIPWNFVREGEDYRSYGEADAVLFVQTLASDAGVGDKEVCALLGVETGAADPTAPASAGGETGSDAGGSETPAVGGDTVRAYSEAYYDAVGDIINQYGYYTPNEDRFLGFLRGDLIDFEGDVVPELVCIYAKGFFANVRIYRYTGGRAELLVDEPTGNAILGDNWSDIYYTVIGGKPYVLTQNCDWGETEKIKIFTVDGGALVTTAFYADVIIYNDYIKHYINCRINDKNVSEEVYLAKEKYYYKDAIGWDYLKENGKWRDYEKDDAEKFIRSLAAGAGVGETAVGALLNGQS